MDEKYNLLLSCNVQRREFSTKENRSELYDADISERFDSMVRLPMIAVESDQHMVGRL